MRVLFNCLSSVSGGGRTYLRHLASLLHHEFVFQGRHELIFIAYRQQAELLQGLPDTCILWIEGEPLNGFRRVLWEIFSLHKIVKKNSVDVLFSPYQVGPSISGIKNVKMIRNMEPFFFIKYKYEFSTWLRNKILSLVSIHSLASADRVIAVSNFASRVMEDINSCSREVRIIHHGCPALENVADLDQQLKLKVGNNFLLTSGSMLPYRRYEDAIKAFNFNIAEMPPNLKLVIAGSGSDKKYFRKIKKTISSSPDPSRIVLLGNVQWEPMIKLYYETKALIITTEIEACPNIALEAMSAGCSIISNNSPPLPEILGNAPLYYDARNIGKLSKAMLEIINNDQVRISAGKQAKLRSQYFSWQRCADETYRALTDW